MPRLTGRKHLRPLPLLLALVVLLAVAVTAPAAAAVPCTVAALSALGVANVAILAAADVPAAPPNPEYCNVFAAVTTSGQGAGNGSALVNVQLPANWKGKFLFFGTGGLAGAPFPSANAVDVGLALQKGYATAVTDAGHTGHGPDGLGIFTDASWSITAPGVPDTPKVVDYYFRAVHDVTVAGKQLVKAFFDAPRIDRAYFDGCSNGGRMAFVQATRFPDDYDGIIAGAPFLDIRVVLGGVGKAKALLTSDSYIPFVQLPLIDQAVYTSCDAADGVSDNLIQNPAACAFDPDTLVPGTLSQPQADALKVYLGATRDHRGGVLYPGFAVSDLHGGGMDAWTTGFVAPFGFGAAEPWGDSGFSPAPIGFQFVDHILKYLVERDPTFDVHTFGVSADGVVSPGGARAVRRADGGRRRRRAREADVVHRQGPQDARLPWLQRPGPAAVPHRAVLRGPRRHHARPPPAVAGQRAPVHGARHAALRRRPGPQRVRHADAAGAVGGARPGAGEHPGHAFRE